MPLRYCSSSSNFVVSFPSNAAFFDAVSAKAFGGGAETGRLMIEGGVCRYATVRGSRLELSAAFVGVERLDTTLSTFVGEPCNISLIRVRLLEADCSIDTISFSDSCSLTFLRGALFKGFMLLCLRLFADPPPCLLSLPLVETS